MLARAGEGKAERDHPKVPQETENVVTIRMVNGVG